MARYIDADALYEQTAEWEARALAVVENLNSKPLEEMDANELTEWRKWSCILNERSAFKHDVADAPIADVRENVRGEWIIHETENDRYDDMICPFCKKSYTVDAYRIDDIGFTADDFNFCPNCGAEMSKGGDAE